MAKTHICQPLKECWPGTDKQKDCPGTDILSVFVDDEIGEWVLKYEHRADVQEVRMGEADYEGEILMSHSFVIYFCPYCGEKLE